MRSRELDVRPTLPEDTEELLARLETPSHDRYELLFEAIRRGRQRGRDLRAHGDRPLVRGRDRARSRAARTPRPGWCARFKSVDTCAAEFEAATPYFYSGWERPGPDGAAPRGAPRRPARRS